MNKTELQAILTDRYNRGNWKNLLMGVFHGNGLKVNFDEYPVEVPLSSKAADYRTTNLFRLGDLKLADGKTIALFETEVQNTRIAKNRVGLRSLVAKEIVPNFQDGAFAVFYSREEQEWRFSFITKYQDWNLTTDALYDFETHPKRYTYLFGTPGESYRTALERFGNLASSPKTLENILEAFSVEAFNDQFYKDYQNLSVKLIRAIYSKQVSGKMQAHQGVLNLLNRLLFVCFIQKKGWLMSNDTFVFDLWKDYKATSFGQNAFHEHWLNHVFFSAFNGKAYRNPDLFKNLPKKYHQAVIEFPYLNGGLFTKRTEYDGFSLDDQHFEEIFALLGSYNFTISEDTPEDINLEISPELLGKMYEGMINATDLNDVEAENGIVYTERPEINFMVRRSLVEVLESKLGNQFSKDFLYHFCFDKPGQKSELFKNYNAKVDLLRNALTSITACDPACGSGSMLLGVIQVQMELLRSIDEYLGNPHTPKVDYQLKKQIISECIYGVDIKEWAVRIAELRFWLYMIEEAEFTKEELTKEPLLPNLDFKLRTGNSLLQKFGSMDFTLEDLFKGRDKRSGATRKLSDFIRRKKDFIQNNLEEQTSFEKLKEEECSIFKDFIDELIFEKRARIKQLQNVPPQGDLFSTPVAPANLFQSEIDSHEEEIASLQKIRSFIKSEKRLPFSYDIDFMEVFLLPDDPGFDLIIGNPPYVRQENILPPEDGEYLEHLMKPENKDEKQSINKRYKQTLNARVYDTYPFLAATVKTEVEGKDKKVAVYESKVPGRSDLFIYFQLLCPRYLNSKGTFCFIISNSWLDVDYGKLIQHFLLKHTRLIAIYDCNVRSFSAKVNTVIYLHSGIRQLPQRQQGIPHLKPLDNEVHFVMNKIPYEQAAYAPLLIEQEHCRENSFKDLYRLIVKNQQELYEAGYDEEEKKFTGDKWGGKYLKAPEIYYTILGKGKGKLVPLKEIAEVRFGIKTGANEFFILSAEQAAKWGIESEFLVPFMTSPKDSFSIKIEANGLTNRLFSCDLTKDKLEETNALKYILWGEQSEIINGAESRAFHKRPSCSGRKLWYSIGMRKLAAFNCNYMVGTIMRFYRGKVAAVNNFHEVHVKEEEESSFSITLNSTLFQLFANIIGRSNLGDGLMKVEKFEVEDILVINPNLLSSVSEELAIFEEREQSDLFTELGFYQHLPIRDQEPRPLPDRKALDDLIFNELGLTQAERKEVYWATAELVKQRLDKASSYKGSQKTRQPRTSFATPNEDENVQMVRQLIANGEDKRTEFKSSLRPGAGSTSRFSGVKHNILKSIAAFLNTEGGTLLIGIAPDSSISGLEAHDYTTFIEPDKADAWRKHFDNTVQAYFGNHLHPLIELDLIKVDGNTVAQVRVKSRAPREVWLKNKDDRDREEFYIRRTASTTKLEGAEATEYIRQVWQ